MENVRIGLITKTQGLKGDFRVKVDNKYLAKVSNLTTVTILGFEYHVKKIVNRGGFCVFSLNEFNDINQIENLINKPIFATLEEPESLAEYYVDYLVIANSCEVGVVEAVNNYGATDVITLTNGKMFAVSPNLIISVDEANKKIVVDANVLNEVLVWK